MARTNLVNNPRGIASGSSWSRGGGAPAASYTSGFVTGWDQGVEPGVTTGFRFTIVDPAAATSLYSLPHATARFTATPGKWIAAAAVIDTSRNAQVRVFLQWYTSANAFLSSSTLVSDTGVGARRLIWSGQAPSGSGLFSPYAGFPSATAGQAAGDTLTVGAWVVAEADTEADALAAVNTYFDGSTPATSVYRYAWTGAANASASVESPWITATLVDAGTPRPVQLALAGIPAGAAYSVVGTSGAGASSWPVPGGTGVGTGQQILLVDNRSALNTPVLYQAVIDGVTRVAENPVTVAGPDFVLQTLDGRTSTTPDTILEYGTFAEKPVIRAATYDIPGRSRPPVRFAAPGAGGSSIGLITDRRGSEQVRALIKTGAPLAMRCGKQIRDLPAVDLIQITAASSVSYAGRDGIRVWTLDYLLVDDPEPGTPLSVWTWDDFDAAGLTWDEFDALGLTWDEFDAYDWGQLLP